MNLLAKTGARLSEAKRGEKCKEVKIFKVRLTLFLMREKVKRGLFASVFGVISLFGVFFSVSKFTGNAIGSSGDPGSFIGALLFLGGLAGVFSSLKD